VGKLVACALLQSNPPWAKMLPHGRVSECRSRAAHGRAWGPAALPLYRIRDHLSFSWLTSRTTSAVSRETCMQSRGSSADVVVVVVVG
jgi:hypothetical protein